MEAQLKHLEGPIPMESPKIKGLIEEFKIAPPSLSTYLEVNQIIRNGLPLVKSISIDAANHLLTTGRLEPSPSFTKQGFPVVYTSLVIPYGYGPISLVLDPKILAGENFTPYCLDNGSTYVQHQQEEINPGNIYAPGIKRKVMDKYKLTPDEFRNFFSYWMASLTDFPVENDFERYQNWRQLSGFVTFDIGVPAINLSDISDLYYKVNPSTVSLQEEQTLDKLAQSRGFHIQRIEKSKNDPIPFGQEMTIAEILIDRFGIPEKFAKVLQMDRP